jgi:hypothetical protein
MAALVSPENEWPSVEPESMPEFQLADDFGYGAGAAFIKAAFALRHREVRKRLPSNSASSALATLREWEAAEREALRDTCAKRRREALLALRNDWRARRSASRQALRQTRPEL